MSLRRWLVVAVGVLVLLAGGYFFVAPVWNALGGRLSRPSPVVMVHAQYPGASADVVADTVAAPIEQQVSGVENLVGMWSECRNDGTYVLHLVFEPGTDLNMNQVLVQNRVSLAEPVLPDVVKRAGLAVKNKVPHAVAFVVVSSPDGRYDSAYLGNYAAHLLRDELIRVPGAGDVQSVGASSYRVTIDLDPDRLASHGLTVAAVIQALNQAKVSALAAPGQEGKLPLARVQVQGDKVDVEKLAEAVLKSDDKEKVLVRDVGKVELSKAEVNRGRHQGKDVAVLAICPLPEARASEVRSAVRSKLAELRDKFPPGIDATATFDRSAEHTGDYLRLEIELPGGASRERTLEVVRRCEQVLQKESGVKETLALCGPPFAPGDNQACLLVRAVPGEAGVKSGAELMERIRSRLRDEVRDASVRVCDVSSAIPPAPLGYAVDFAVCDAANKGSAETYRVARELADALEKSGKLTDVAPSARADTPQLYIDIDRTRANALGVPLSDVFAVLQVYLGSYYVSDFNQFGRTWQVRVQADSKMRMRAEDILQLQVKNSQGQLVRLGTIASVQMRSGPLVLSRFDMYPGVRITANLAPGVSLSEARKLCESHAGDVPAGYQLIWLPTVSVRE